MDTTIYAADAGPAEQVLKTVTDWIAANQVTTWTAGGAAALLLFASGLYLTIGTLRGRNRNAKAAIGYAIVQTGMAYVTITGGYDFWHLVAHMNAVEAATLSVFIESAQWVVLARAFMWMDAHTEDNPHIGYGRAGAYFWLFVMGGNILAVLGALVGQDNGPLALGRTVAVVIGSLLWDLLLRARMHRDPSIPPTVLLLTWRKIGIRLGIMAAEAKDNVTQDREWTLRRMSRALRWKNEGVWLFKWLGERYLMRAMDAGDATLFSQAVDRYALNWLIRNEINAKHKTMEKALTSARRVLDGVIVLTPPPDITPPKRIILPSPSRPRPSQPDSTQESVASAAALRDEARQWAIEQIRAGVALTGAEVALQFHRKDEWGRLRLREAEAELARGDGTAA